MHTKYHAKYRKSIFRAAHMCLIILSCFVPAKNKLFQGGYKNLLRKFCNVIWNEGGVVRGISTLGTRQFPHYQEAKTESGSEKVWKGT